MHVLAICATCGRHTLLERSLRLFLEQTYIGEHTLLIYNNSPIAQRLSSLELPDNKQVILINNHIDSLTGQQYTSLGAIYNDIIKRANITEYDIVTHWDDDDLFLPDHIKEGVWGLVRTGGTAYKPKYSFYRSDKGVTLSENTLEPSIFVDSHHVAKYGYSLTTTEQHLQWVNPLIANAELFVDPSGKPTLIYNWGDTDIWTYKTSGDYHNPANFDNCRNFSQDHGDFVITPWNRKEVEKYYNQANYGKSPKANRLKKK